MPEEAESAMAACSEAPAHLGRYEWTQTKQDLTITVALPPGTSTKQVTCRVSTDDTRAIELTIAGATVPLLQGYLHAKARRSVWWIEAGTTFILDIEKHRPRFWKCALVGGPQVDVSALVEQHRRDNEPACQPDPALQQAPRKVHDRDEMLKIKAEFPQLQIGVEQPNAAHHKPHTGQKKRFDWGSLPGTEGQGAAGGGGSESAQVRAQQQQSPGTEATSSAASPAAPAPIAGAAKATGGYGGSEGGKFSWGSLPAEAAPTKPVVLMPSDPPAKYSWGSLPQK